MPVRRRPVLNASSESTGSPACRLPLGSFNVVAGHSGGEGHVEDLAVVLRGKSLRTEDDLSTPRASKEPGHDVRERCGR